MTHHLFNHQIAGVNHVLSAGGSGGLYWEPGLGKTLGALEIFGRLRVHNPALALLVVCPNTSIGPVWEADITKFTQFSCGRVKSLSIQDIQSNEFPEILIINYESFFGPYWSKFIHKFITANPVMCVLDESQRLRSPRTRTTKTFHTLAPLFKHRLVLSGTPCPNNEFELWGQVNFIKPGTTETFWKFQQAYGELARGDSVMRSPDPRIIRELLRKGYEWRMLAHMRQKLMDMMAPRFHWAYKRDCLDLPPQIDAVRTTELNHTEERAYRHLKRRLVLEWQDKTIAVSNALVLLTKLRQVACGFIYDDDGNVLHVGESRLRTLEDVVDECGRGEQILIFSNFKASLKAIGLKLSCPVLDGSAIDRDEMIGSFQCGRTRILAANPMTAGQGLTFANCHNVIFHDCDYSYERYFQARQRVHRIGQTLPCLYYHIVADRTVDESIMRVLRRKESLQGAIRDLLGVQLEEEGLTPPEEEVSFGVGLQDI